MSQPDPRGVVPLPRVLVLLASYDGRQWIEPQLATILSQRGVSVTVLVSDDMSRDGTGALVRSLAASDDRVRVLDVSTPSGSAGANFRRLFRAAELDGFDFVALADQDDVWLDGKLIHAIRCLGEAKADGYSSTVTAFWPDGRERALEQDRRQRAADFLFEGAGQGCTFVLAAGFFRRVQAFCCLHPAQADALHYHDWLVYLLARTAGYRWVFDPTSRIRYRQHESNEIGARGGVGAALHRLRKIQDGWFRAQVEAAIDACATVGHQDAIVLRFGSFFARGVPQRGARRLRLAVALGRYSRRRSSDRLVLMMSALLGWL